MNLKLNIAALLICMAITGPTALFAADIVSDKSIGMDLARDIANEAVQACRDDGYHVSVVVVDRHGLVRAALRDDLAARFTLEIAERKANMTVMAWTDSGQFREARADIRPELNHIDGLIVMDGGVRITAGGYNIGALGVSGAMCVRVPITREYFGVRSFGTIYGILSIFTVIGGVAGAPIAAWIYDSSGTYFPIWYVYAGLTTAGMLMLLMLPKKDKYRKDLAKRGINISDVVG